ncbi:tRNA (uracil-5-)-methyltransferase [Thraustotheca clavata]|uniref:tRNA (Uracil-5-)-methyltransferase n=1 Tax=Thraustotheca clavata TaxID=74557 RepID=A0A1V9ZZS5_9STRA|nr:tRNA (uracil-5-)-methyltransferase [Thraustotheca clavata]
MGGQRKQYGKKRKAADSDVAPGHLTKNDECKIIVLNFGQWSEKEELAKVLEAHNHSYKAIQKLNKLSFGFVIYESKEERDAALEVLDKIDWKNGEKLEVKAALPKKSLKPIEKDDTGEPGQLKTVIEAVTPWHHVEYAEQLERKEDAMKKVLVKIVRQTRKEFADKQKRVIDERKRMRKQQKVETIYDVVGGPPLEIAVPEWLDATGSLYIVSQDKLFQQVLSSNEAPWVEIATAEGITDLVSFTSELVGVHKDGSLFTYQKHTKKWSYLSNGPTSSVTALASLRGHLLCATTSGEVVRRVVKGRRDVIEWVKLASDLGSVTAMTVHQGFLYIATSNGWQKAPLGPEATTILEFGPCPEISAANVFGLTSHDAKLIFVQKQDNDDLHVVHVETNGKLVSSTKIDITNTISGFASHKGLCCPMEPIAPSPILEGYRNKCEFTFGYDINKKPVVGFRIGMYKEGVVAVGSADKCINVPQVMKDICRTFQAYLESSPLPVYDVMTHEGVWRLLTIRLSERTKQIMLMIQANPSNIEADVWTAEKAKLISTLTQTHPAITSMYMQEYIGVSAPSEDHPIEHVFGATTIEEELLGLKFRISAQAFFQVNTPGAEVLYSLVKRFAAAGDSTQVYDVCCGTGTIGICVASDARNVIGVELCKAATDDAAVNAELNNISNITFINSKAEDVMKDLLRKKPEGEGAEFVREAVAIVDPPRAGLHTKVLRSLRDTRPVKRIVYVSCNPTVSLINDATTLCGPCTSNLRGEPFKPVFAAPVDMFPHTEHCEMIIVFERV